MRSFFQIQRDRKELRKIRRGHARCEHGKCRRDGLQCTIVDFQKDHIEWFCHDHARLNGYCPCCGAFISGTEQEFNSGGYCDNCRDQIREDSGSESEAEDYYEPPYDQYDESEAVDFREMIPL